MPDITESAQRTLQKAPELHPTNEEFVHPIKYLSKPEIVELGEKYGILKVIPPENWDPKFALDWNSFKFHTRIQNLHELNLRNRSRACFIEGFNCFLLSKNLDPLPTTDDLCFGTSDYFKLTKKNLFDHLNGWILLKNNQKIHVHEIFISKEYRKWFYKINDSDKSLLKHLTEYSKYLLKVLGLTDDLKKNDDIDNIVISPELTNTTLHRMMLSPASLLAQPNNIKQLMRMKTKTLKNKRKRGIISTKTNKLANIPSSILTPPIDSFQFKKQKLEDDKKSITYNPITPELLSPEILDETCVICHDSRSPETTLLCDNCSRGFHMKCLPKPFEKIPKNDWFCDDCLVGSTGVYGEYGFEEELENKFSLNDFKKYCEDWENELINIIKAGKLGDKFISLVDSNNKLSEDSKEKLFWYMTNGEIMLPIEENDEESEKLKIRYGADIHSDLPGEVSGFPTWDNPRVTKDEAKIIESEWNLTKLPFAQGSLLEYVCQNNENGDEINNKEQISGMSIPWIYIGGTMSTFCWHKEDHFTLSANYSHLGAPKKWYGIPARCCKDFEKIINDIAPEYEAKQKDLLHQLVSMVSPDELKNNENFKNVKNLEIFEAIQRPGEFIITFPKVYHSGFNYGFNVNEAVNFTLPLWVPYSVSAVEEYENVGKECVFDTFALLKKIVGDLITEEGRNKWIEETGISELETFNIMKWGYDKYREEILKFLKIFEDDEIFKEDFDKLEKINIKEYLIEKNNIFKNSKGLHKHDLNKNNEEDEENDENENEIEIDDKLCTDCKTRVHFQWVLINLYDDSIREANKVLIENGKNEKEINGLGIKIENNHIKEEGKLYKDFSSEINDIINKAKEEELNVNSNNNEKEVKRRQSRRIIKKRKFGESDDNENDNKNNQDIIKTTKEIIDSLKILKEENGFFGTSVMCVKCFRKELKELSKEEKMRILNDIRVVEEYEMKVLKLYK